MPRSQRNLSNIFNCLDWYIIYIEQLYLRNFAVLCMSRVMVLVTRQLHSQDITVMEDTHRCITEQLFILIRSLDIDYSSTLVTCDSLR